MKSKNVIELNGHRYDATTGKIVGAASAPQVRPVKNIDGFFRARSVTIAPVTTKVAIKTQPAVKQASRAVNHAQAHIPQPAKTLSVREPVLHEHTIAVHHGAQAHINHIQAHKTQTSSILMRKSVRRPEPSFKQQATIQGSLQHKVPSLIASKQSAYSINPDRIIRAHNTARSPQIVHHTTVGERVPVTIASLAVQAVPPKPGAAEPIAPAPQPTNKPVDMFEQAIANASHFVDTKTHHMHFKKQARRHAASMAAGVLALAVIAGFAAYQNTPGLQLKVASIQAGVSTNMPNFKAAGFAYNGVKAGDGKLTVGFSGTSGNYQLTQETTNWSDSDMIQEVGATDASGAPNYQTVQAGSTTVYRFSNTTATWVSGGKWYTVTGTGALTDSQVTSLANNV